MTYSLQGEGKEFVTGEGRRYQGMPRGKGIISLNTKRGLS